MNSKRVRKETSQLVDTMEFLIDDLLQIENEIQTRISSLDSKKEREKKELLYNSGQMLREKIMDFITQDTLSKLKFRDKRNVDSEDEEG